MSRSTRGGGQALEGGRRFRLPSVDHLLQSDLSTELTLRFGRTATVDAIRRTLEECRRALRAGAEVHADAASVLRATASLLAEEDAPSLRRVINLTGTVLHTNLGRAILAEKAVAAAVEAMRSAVTLEFDLGDGVRGERDDHVRGLLRELTGAEDACVVNNNAGAVLLTLNTLAGGKEALVSRGELIEIGGAFRLPDIMARAGARLVEVGTTNRTHLKDYAGAIGAETGLVLKAHTSNYIIQGFTKSVPPAELAALARSHSVPFVHDLGSGALVDLARYGLVSEPTVRQTLREGADLVTFSGDKLLGGPQAGIIAGRKDLVARIARNPMKRALRLDKMRLAALEATLRLYRDPDRLPETLPTLRAFTRSRSELEAAAARLLPRVGAALPSGLEASPIACMSQIGSGALPLETLPSAGISIRATGARKSSGAVERLSRALRELPVPVVGRIKDGALILDLRGLDDEGLLIAQLEVLASRAGSAGGADVQA
ncbi:MAG: L-seryl-tRNA(Sec) selenium transferase [Hyphomicrobiaceae bacterium]|nr:L-seryl-tRNA(Sec) selenium transferase [Hyphomicrobiaceae bacterium]